MAPTHSEVLHIIFPSTRIPCIHNSKLPFLCNLQKTRNQCSFFMLLLLLQNLWRCRIESPPHLKYVGVRVVLLLLSLFCFAKHDRNIGMHVDRSTDDPEKPCSTQHETDTTIISCALFFVRYFRVLLCCAYPHSSRWDLAPVVWGCVSSVLFCAVRCRDSLLRPARSWLIAGEFCKELLLGLGSAYLLRMCMDTANDGCIQVPSLVLYLATTLLKSGSKRWL